MAHGARPENGVSTRAWWLFLALGVIWGPALRNWRPLLAFTLVEISGPWWLARHESVSADEETPARGRGSCFALKTTVTAGIAHCTAAPAFTIPAPKNDVRLPSPVHWRASSLGQPVGHASEVADARILAATAPCGRFGFICRINAATPATCGEAIDVPLIQT